MNQDCGDRNIIKISVLIAAYKAEKWICQSVESVLSQKLSGNCRLEVIIGVDGCTKTLKEARKFAKDERVGIVNFKKNNGTYNVFNSLVGYSSGEYLLRHDADDVMGDCRIKKMVDILESESKISMVGTYWTSMDGNLREVKKTYKHAATGVWMWRRSVWKNKIGGFREWRCRADREVFQRAKYLGLKGKVIPDANLYFRRTHPNSLEHHPKTRIGSKFRNQYVKQMKDNEKSYKKGNKPSVVNPTIFIGNPEGRLLENNKK